MDIWKSPGMLPENAAPIGQTLWSVPPGRILWQSDHGVDHAETLLACRPFQPLRPDPLPACVLSPGGAILIDFGRELNGTVELAVGAAPGRYYHPASLRIRLGESASEAMAELGERVSGNDYAIRDETVVAPWIGTKTVGPSGFRFVRIDCAGQIPVPLTHIRAVLALRDIEPTGRFQCSDDLVTKIWEVGAWTTRLNLQEHIWDGIKRDRLVWMGDLQPVAGALHAAFGPDEAMERSLDLIRDTTPPGMWMNGISSYSLWWIVVQERWWWAKGDLAYLQSQRDYLQSLCEILLGKVDTSFEEKLDGMRFIDWPTAGNEPATSAGLQALLCLALDAGSRLLLQLGEAELASRCASTARKARKVAGDPGPSKAIIALRALAGMEDLEPAAALLEDGGARGLTAFLGSLSLEVLARSGRIDPALEIMRSYWGGMIERGATSYWEEFDIEWLNGSGRIDELPAAGQRDLHGDFGRFGHSGFRMSLCHAWTVGPTAWLSENVLGVRPMSPGFASVSIRPQLGSLKWAEGTYPTPLGNIHVRHERTAGGKIQSEITTPEGVKHTDECPGLLLL
jgi:hypothetical protein